MTPKKPTKKTEIQPAMTVEELRAADIPIEVPLEGASADPQPLRYAKGTAETWVPDPEWAKRTGFKQEKDDGL